MIKPIVASELLLRAKSKQATAEDAEIARNLLDTLRAHAHECVGMAANMIGERKRIIAVNDNDTYLAMLNPEVLSHAGEYQTEEGCLSLSGTRPTTRWKTIKVTWQDEKMRRRTKTFTGFTAQIIQHEIDHCNGVVI